MRIRDLLIVSSLAASPLAMAGCPPSLGIAQQVVCLQQENAVLQQRLANAQVEQSLAKLSSAASPARDLGWPQVTMIYGSPGREKAALLWVDASGQSQGTLVVADGDRLPGGMQVESIASNRVVLRRGKSEHVLLMGSASEKSSTAAPAQPAAAYPSSAFSATQIPPPPAPLTQGGRP